MGPYAARAMDRVAGSSSCAPSEITLVLEDTLSALTRCPWFYEWQNAPYCLIQAKAASYTYVNGLSQEKVNVS